MWGIDVSSNNHLQGDIDWPTTYQTMKAKDPSQVPFTWVKVSEGLSYTNPYWANDRAGAHAAGFQVGLYHFGRPSEGSGHD